MASSLEDLLQELQSEGSLDSAGEFTLDAAKAAQKLAYFQLEDSYEYVLLLVESAVLQGASRLDFRISARELVFWHDAPPTDNWDAPASRLLLMGLSAVEPLRPISAWVELLQEGSWRRLRAPSWEWEPASQPAEAGTHRVVVRHRTGLGSLVRFLGRRPSREAAVLQQRACLCSVPLSLNRRPISPPRPKGLGTALLRLDFGQKLPCPAVEGLETLQRPSLKGMDAVLWAPLSSRNKASRVDFVVNGVVAGWRNLSNPYLSMEGAVSCQRLKHNLSRSDLVEDSGFQLVVKIIVELARIMLLELARRAQRLGPEQVDAVTRAVLLRYIGDKMPVRDFQARKVRGWQELKSTLADVPLFRTTRGGYTALRPLLDQYLSLGHLPVATSRVEPSETLVVVVEAPTRLCLQKVFPRWVTVPPC